ncbi:MAG TPA: LysE family translocator [Nitratifractor sp.]|nr:LysE family translocator [Nitratifractor sp.]HHD74950.1 LysE family translocator [Nitratifractor sp.]HHH20962.1 LysE family translocator [Nitratifractor sp.]
MSFETISLYTVVAFFYITSPGPAIFLAIANGLRADMETVAISSLANILGLAVLSTASILGLGAIITTSATLFLIVKVIGALYLIYLGIKFIRNNKGINVDAQLEKIERVKSKKEYFREAFFLAVTNPKPILFFTAIFPQFLNHQSPILPQFLTMTLIFLTISFSSLFAYGYIAKKSKRVLSNAKRMNWFNKITGAIFISIGIGLLQLKRVEA